MVRPSKRGWVSQSLSIRKKPWKTVSRFSTLTSLALNWNSFGMQASGLDVRLGTIDAGPGLMQVWQLYQQTGPGSPTNSTSRYPAASIDRFGVVDGTTKTRTRGINVYSAPGEHCAAATKAPPLSSPVSNGLLWLIRIYRLRWTTWIITRSMLVIVVLKPILSPFRYISGHVVETKGVRWVTPNWSAFHNQR